jgi:hypothetical protein
MFFQGLPLALLMTGADLDQAIAQLSITVRGLFGQAIENIKRKKAVSGTLFSYSHRPFAEELPGLGDLAGDQPTEDMVDAAGGEEITLLTDPLARSHVVAMVGMVEAALHKIDKGDPILLLQFFTQQSGKVVILFGRHVHDR